MNSVHSTLFAPVDYERDHIFTILHSYATYANTELFGKVIWLEGNLRAPRADLKKLEDKNKQRLIEGKPEKNYVSMYLYKDVNTMCGMTVGGLLTSFFGRKFIKSPDYNAIREEPARAVEVMKQVMITQESSNKTLNKISNFFNGLFENDSIPSPVLDENSWTVYSILIKGGLGHVLVIVQAYVNNEVVYKIYQSFVRQYTLDKYLSQHDYALTRSEVYLLLDEILDYVNATNFTPKSDHLFRHYFNADPRLSIGQEIGFKRELALRWGNVTRESFKKFALEYQAAYPTNLKIKSL